MAIVPSRARKLVKLVLNLQKNGLLYSFAESCWHAYRTPDLFDNVRRYCFFVGYPHSGHTLLGSLLNAHPNAVISHELHSTKYLGLVPNSKWFYAMHLGADTRFAKRQRNWTGYDYRVPGQSHGRFDQIEVIGDKRGGGTTLSLYGNPNRLSALRALVDVPIRVIHQVRNPFDNIATTARHRKITLEQAIEVFESLLEKNRQVLMGLAENEWLLARHEDLIASPKAELARVIRFLELGSTTDYLEACASIVFQSPTRPRFNWDWSPSQIERVSELIASSPYHEHYSFDEEEI